MKNIIFIIMTCSTLCAYAQIAPPKYDWNVTLKAIDEAGRPVATAKMHVYYLLTNEIAGLTDTNGIFTASHNDGSENLAFEAEKAGYYSFSIAYHLGDNYKPEKWNFEQTIILKRIVKPIPMYAMKVRTHVPDVDKAIGYDLMVGDWIKPYGRGIQSDILFMAHFDKSNKEESYYQLTVSFPNKGDGIQEFGVPTYYLHSAGSALRSSEEAPANDYKPEWIQTDDRKASQPVKTNRDVNRNYYVRVRTKVDNRGKIVSALYGKIYGDFMTFSYYLNPTPNDRNVEFDPKQNLFKHLSADEQVTAP